MRKFEFDKTYDELEIAGKVYKVDFSDDSLKKYFEAVQKYQTDLAKTNKVDTDKLSDEENLQQFEFMKNTLKDFMETVLGDNTFDELYEKSGRSVLNLVDLAYEISDMINEKGENKRDQKRKQYVKKNKK